MPKSIKWKLIVALTAGCITFGVGILAAANQLLFRHCLWWECAPSRSFTVFDIGLPNRYLPRGADVHPLQPLRGDLTSVEAAATTDYLSTGRVIYVVRRFGAASQARRDYENNVPFRFTTPMATSHAYDSIINYRSNVADQSSAQCGYVLSDFRCVYIARYAEFTVFFSGSIGDGAMSQGGFIEVMGYLDERMRQLLDHP